VKQEKETGKTYWNDITSREVFVPTSGPLTGNWKGVSLGTRLVRQAVRISIIGKRGFAR